MKKKWLASWVAIEPEPITRLRAQQERGLRILFEANIGCEEYPSLIQSRLSLLLCAGS